MEQKATLIMLWLRLYDDMLDDPKVQKLPPAVFKTLVNLWCLANKSSPRGYLPSDDDVEFRLRISSEVWQEHKSRLIAASLLDTEENGLLRPHNWDEHQPPSDSSTDRVREHRARKKVEQNGHVTEETLPKRSSNALEAEQSRADLDKEQSRAEEEECEEKPADTVSAPPAPPFSASAFPAQPSARPVPLPPLSLREEANGLLSEADIADLLTSAPKRGSPTWTEGEIREGVRILRERIKSGGLRPAKPKAYLHTSILPEVREGKRANVPPKQTAHSPPAETDEEMQARLALRLAELDKKHGKGDFTNANIPP